MPSQSVEYPRSFGIQIEQGREGLWYATSQEFPGLLVGTPTLGELWEEISEALKVLTDDDSRETIGQERSPHYRDVHGILREESRD